MSWESTAEGNKSLTNRLLLKQQQKVLILTCNTKKKSCNVLEENYANLPKQDEQLKAAAAQCAFPSLSLHPAIWTPHGMSGPSASNLQCGSISPTTPPSTHQMRPVLVTSTRQYSPLPISTSRRRYNQRYAANGASGPLGISPTCCNPLQDETIIHKTTFKTV